MADKVTGLGKLNVSELQIGGTALTVTPAQLNAEAALISDIAITYTSNDPSITPDGAVTVADGSTPTVAELLELCEEIIANQNAIIDALQARGIVASS